VAGAEFNHFAVIESGCVGEERLRASGAEKFVEIGVVQGRVEMELRGVSIEERAIRFGDGDDLNVGAMQGGGKEAVGVAVNKARDGDAERRFGFGGGKRRGAEDE